MADPFHWIRLKYPEIDPARHRELRALGQAGLDLGKVWVSYHAWGAHGEVGSPGGPASREVRRFTGQGPVSEGPGEPYQFKNASEHGAPLLGLKAGLPQESGDPGVGYGPGVPTLYGYQSRPDRPAQGSRDARADIEDEAPAARPEHPADLPEGGHPVRRVDLVEPQEHRRQVEALVGEGEAGGVGKNEGYPGGPPLPGADPPAGDIEHHRRGVHPDHLSFRPEAEGKFPGQESGAAADIDHPFGRAWPEAAGLPRDEGAVTSEGEKGHEGLVEQGRTPPVGEVAPGGVGRAELGHRPAPPSITRRTG